MFKSTERIILTILHYTYLLTAYLLKSTSQFLTSLINVEVVINVEGVQNLPNH